MMQSTQRSVVVLAVALLAFGLIGCGSGPPSTSDDGADAGAVDAGQTYDVGDAPEGYDAKSWTQTFECYERKFCDFYESKYGEVDWAERCKSPDTLHEYESWCAEFEDRGEGNCVDDLRQCRQMHAGDVGAMPDATTR